MKNPKLSNRYAKALFDFANEKGQIESVNQDLSILSNALKDSHELQALLSSPVIEPAKKHTIFSNVFKDKISETTFAFLDIIIKKKREPALVTICDEFRAFYNEHHHIKTATLISAQPMSPELVDKIRDLLAEQTKYSIEIEQIVRPSLIGGIQIKIGDQFLDASIQYKINKLKQEFAHNIYQVNF